MSLAVDIPHSVNVIGKHIELSQHSHFSLIKKNQRIDIKKNNQIAFLTKGTITMHKLDDDLATITIKGPAIIGLGQMRGDSIIHFVRCNTNCELWVMDSDEAFRLFYDNNLWQHAFDILTKHLYMFFAREKRIHKSNVKEVVIEHLRIIWGFDEQTRKDTSIYSYILNRNNISRSGVHKVICELRRTGVINVIRGRLIDFKVMASTN